MADSGYAALSLLAACAALSLPVTVITRLRLDAALYAPAPPRQPKQNGRPRVKGARLPTLAACATDPTTCWQPVTVTHWYRQGERIVELASHTALWYHTGLPPVSIRWVLIRDPQGVFTTQALLCTDLTIAPEQVVAWFVLRWQMEVTLEEVRRHLGVETQRQWTHLAIERTTPALLGLFALVTLLAHPHLTDTTPSIRQAAWYRKRAPTFSDALARVRRELWAYEAFCLSDAEAEMVKVPRILMERLTDTLCYVA